MRKKKGTFKRIIAGLLGVMTMATAVPVSTFAAGSTVNITFAYMYESNGSQIKYQDSYVGTDGVDGGPGKAAMKIYANGEDAYCTEPGAPLNVGDKLIINASEAWNKLPSNKKEGVKMALAFGKPGNAKGLSGSEDAKYLATQMLVWEFICGYRDVSSYERKDNSIYNAFCKGGANSEVATNYNAIVNAMKNWEVKPSFANDSTYEMKWQDGKYILTIKDTKGVLNGYTVTSDDSNVKIAKSGNTLTLTSEKYLAKNPTITLTKTSNISGSAVIIPYGSPTLQDVVTGVAKPQDVTASFHVNTPGGTLKLVKTSEDGVVEGIQMTIKGDGVLKTVTTGKNGEVSVEGMIPGEYTVSETVAHYYEPQKEQKVTITSGETTTVKFANVLKRGDLSVAKTSEDGFTEGMKFHLYGTSASGAKVDLYATTDAKGIATFKNVLIAGVSGYTLEEVDTAIRYVIPEDQSVTVAWKEVTNASVKNRLKKFNVSVVKKDAEVQNPQGNGTLAGAVYGIYQDGELVDTYTTDENGNFTTKYYTCGSDWTIREITPSEGYLLDEKEYHVGAEPENYTVEFNSAPSLISHEQVIKGNVSIIKHTDDGSTQIETPEEGAVFQIYLAAAGSFENAEEAERDTLVCDKDGFAQSKDLPYGIYTVHQTEGWEDTEFMKDFTVFISENGKTYKYLINNAPYSAYIKVVKADKETGKTIPLTGAGFQIFNAAGEKISMSYTYPTPTTIDTFYVSEDGYLITPQKLETGEYTLVEVQAPHGYVLDATPIPFTVNSKNQDDAENLTVITVTAYDQAQKGTISVSKSGEVFTSVAVAGEEKDAMYSPVYEEKALAGASYQVIAAEDIVTGDGTIRVEAGQVVAELTTGKDGTAKTEELYLGKYQVIETKAPDGFVLNAEPKDVELVYAGQEVSVTSTSTSFVNNRQKLEMSAVKTMEQDELFGLGMNGEITAVSFGLYAKEEIVAADGSKIPANGLLEIAFADEKGNIQFQTDLPFGRYYVKELTTDPHYVLDETVYEVNFEYAGQDLALQSVVLNKGEAISNKLKYGKIVGLKVNDEVADGEEKGMAGAVFGLFKEGTMELTKENAIATATSDETGTFVFEKIPYGDYLVVELEEPEGYVLSDARHFVSVSFDEQVIGLKVINYPLIGSVELTKVDQEYPDNHLTGAVFEIFSDVDGNKELTEEDTLLGELTECEGGIYRMDGLRYGKYLVKEKKAPEGFLLDENIYPFAITEDGQCQVIENEAGVGFADQVMKGKVLVYKTDKETGEKLVGAGFRVCDLEGNVVAEGKTGEDGTVTFELRYGEYTVAEYEAPEGYVLDETPYSFSITEDGQEISIDMANTKIKGKIVISKIDADTEKLLPDAGFRIYAADGKTVLKEEYTDKKGVAEFELEFGKYFYQEFDAPKGYQIDDTMYEFSISEDGQMVSVVMTNKLEKTPEKPEEPKKPEKPKPEKPSTPSQQISGPKTGDPADLKMWIGISLGAFLAAAVGSYALHKKKKSNKGEKEASE